MSRLPAFRWSPATSLTLAGVFFLLSPKNHFMPAQIF